MLSTFIKVVVRDINFFKKLIVYSSGFFYIILFVLKLESWQLSDLACPGRPKSIIVID
jgi:hypothetical protein